MSAAPLALVFSLGEERFALDGRQVVEVAPRAALRPLPGAPAAVAGRFEFRGAAVPVVDLCRLALGRPCRRHFSTRVIIAAYADGHLGLLAECVTETVRLAEGDSVTEVPATGARFPGRLFRDARGPLLFVALDDLLPAETRRALLSPGGGGTAP